mgnify:CR=1 FL=1
MRVDKINPGILSKLGPFMDDVIAAHIGGASANMYSRGKDDGKKHEKKKVKKTKTRKASSKSKAGGFAG